MAGPCTGHCLTPSAAARRYDPVGNSGLPAGSGRLACSQP